MHLLTPVKSRIYEVGPKIFIRICCVARLHVKLNRPRFKKIIVAYPSLTLAVLTSVCPFVTCLYNGTKHIVTILSPFCICIVLLL